ncbi:hypothetical protein Tco_1344103 [Tanacetum coccineum]
MANFVNAAVVHGPTFAELMDLSGQCEDVRRRLSNLHAMIRELEPIDHRLDIVDTMVSLRDAVRREDDKLVPLLEPVDMGFMKKRVT